MKKPSDLKIPFTWEERRPIMLERFFYIPAATLHSKKEFSFFERKAKVAIEYCSGNGQWVAERARLQPDWNWIAVEKDFSRSRKIWVKEVPNLLIVGGEGLTFTRYYAPKLDAVYINFPDPWPKLRHAKHRLVSVEFVAALAPLLAPGAMVVCATDEGGYAEEMKGVFAKAGSFSPVFHRHEWPEYGASFFQSLWQEKGKTLHYLGFQNEARL